VASNNTGPAISFSDGFNSFGCNAGVPAGNITTRPTYIANKQGIAGQDSPGIGGFLLIVGGLTEVVATLFVAEMIVAIWKVHFVNGFFLNWTSRPGVGHGYEFNAMLICALGCLILSGPGAVSLDRWLRRT